VKILHVIPSLSLVHGGPSRALPLIERALRERGVTVETATTDDDGPGRHLHRPLGLAVEEDGSTRYYFRKTSDAYKVSLSLAHWLRAHVRDYDLLHVHALFSHASIAAARAARGAGVPYVIRPLGTLAKYGMARRRPGLKRLSLRLIEAPLLRDAATAHFTSAMERDEAAALGVPMRSTVIPLALEPLPAANPEDLLAAFPVLRGRRWAIFLSRLDPKKNVEGLLRAIALCAGDLPEMLWLLCGDGEPGYQRRLQELAARLGIAERVVWTGRIDGARKAAALAQAELFVLPSHSENFGIAAAEAMQAGLPVVLGKGVAVSELAVEQGAGVAIEPEPTAIAAALRGYLLDPTSRARAATNAKSLAEREFSLDAMGARLASLYQTILIAPDRKWPGDHGND
jgi:glycosyltransferase involved in cell wall biosynthesis